MFRDRAIATEAGAMTACCADQLIELAQEKPRFGYRRLHILLRRAGQRISHKRVQRVYRAAGLCIRRIRRKRLTRSYTAPRTLAAPNQEWAIDFASDVTASGRRLRVFSVVDAFTRECLALETETSMPSRLVTRVLQKIIDERGAPEFLRSDNALNAREKCRMSAQGLYSTQKMRAVGKISFKEGAR